MIALAVEKALQEPVSGRQRRRKPSRGRPRGEALEAAIPSSC